MIWAVWVQKIFGANAFGEITGILVYPKSWTRFRGAKWLLRILFAVDETNGGTLFSFFREHGAKNKAYVLISGNDRFYLLIQQVFP